MINFKLLFIRVILINKLDNDFRYKSKYHLKMHEKRHINFKRFICGICGKSFLEAQESKIHMRVHTDTRSYQCKYCERKFRTCSQLKVKYPLSNMTNFIFNLCLESYDLIFQFLISDPRTNSYRRKTVPM